MATSQYFRHNVRSEQDLYEDLIIESLKFYGQDMYYLPREVIYRDMVFDDATLSRFDNAYKIEMYIESVEGFDGEGDLFSKFGVELRDAATFVMARRRFTQQLKGKPGFEAGKDYRPREGDLIYLPMSQSIFQIMRVETENPFYQLGQLPVFRMRCELFEYNDEDFDTGVEEIDVVEKIAAYQYVLTMDSASVGYSVGEVIVQSTANYDLSGEVVSWSDSDLKLYVAHVGADDGDYHSFLTTQQVIGQESGAIATPSLVQQLQEIQTNAPGGASKGINGNDLSTFDVTAFEFLDLSESNVFGDPQ